jgi:hypothetical protein
MLFYLIWSVRNRPLVHCAAHLLVWKTSMEVAPKSRAIVSMFKRHEYFKL